MSLTATPGQETAAPVRRPGTHLHLGSLSTCTLRHASDDRLVALTRAGSERAFAEIMRRYQRPLQFYCLHLVGAPRAEDAVQQAFMQAFVSLRDGAQREIALRPWLYRIARNCAIDLLRKQPFEHDELDPDYDGLPQTPGVFEQKEELARVVAAIQALPEGQRRALTLRELEGRSYGEISAELGHTDSGVRQLIFRARTALRNLGALLLPLDSLRFRLLGSAPAVADPQPIAAAASVSSAGGGNVFQAAASAVAATVTLLGAGPPANRQPRVVPPPLVSQATGASLPPGFATVSGDSVLDGHRRQSQRVLRRSGGAPVLAGAEDVAPVPADLTAPVIAAPSVAPPAVAEPPAPAPAPTAPDPALAAAPVPVGAADAAPVAPATALERPAGSAPSGSDAPPAPPKAGAPASKPSTSPAKVELPVKPGWPSPAKPSPAKPNPPKPVVPPKLVMPKPAPKKPAPAKAPAVPPKPSTPAA